MPQCENCEELRRERDAANETALKATALAMKAQAGAEQRLEALANTSEAQLQAEASLAAVVGALTALEWLEPEDEYPPHLLPRCPSCHNSKPTHSKGCNLGAVLDDLPQAAKDIRERLERAEKNYAEARERLDERETDIECNDGIGERICKPEMACFMHEIDRLEQQAERWRQALEVQWQRAHYNCPDDYLPKEECTSTGCVGAKIALADTGEQGAIPIQGDIDRARQAIEDYAKTVRPEMMGEQQGQG